MESALCGGITGLGNGIYLESIVRFQLEVGGQKTIYAQFVFLVIVGCVLVVGMLGDVIFVRQEWSDTTKLQYALATVHNGQLVLAHKVFAQLLIVEAVGSFPAPALSGVVVE